MIWLFSSPLNNYYSQWVQSSQVKGWNLKVSGTTTQLWQAEPLFVGFPRAQEPTSFPAARQQKRVTASAKMESTQCMAHSEQESPRMTM